MGIFDTIQKGIFGWRDKGKDDGKQVDIPGVTGTKLDPRGGFAQQTGGQTSTTLAPTANPAAGAQTQVDVEDVLTRRAAASGQPSNWRTSIVDLMKLLDLDSSLDARKELATELGYTGAKDGSAEMNIWLHRAVMKKLAANGGRVPADLQG